jgi:hypothetical protein
MRQEATRLEACLMGTFHVCEICEADRATLHKRTSAIWPTNFESSLSSVDQNSNKKKGSS